MSSLLDALRRLGQPKQVQAMSPEAIAQIQNARFGVLANNSQKQQQVIQGGQVQHPNAVQQLLPQLAASIPKVAAATGLAAARIGTGTAQGISGLVDLATPGTGTSRVTDGLNHLAQGIDHTAQSNDINPAYRVMQAALTPASFYAPGALFKAISGVPTAARLAPALNATTPVARIANQALQGATPLNALNAASGIATDLGRQAGQGKQITPLQAGLTTAANVLTPLALPAAGQAALEAGKVAPGLAKEGIQTGAKTTAKTLNLKPHANLSDNEILAAQAYRNARQGFGTGMDITPAEIVHYENFLKKTGLSRNDTSGINSILKVRQLYEDTKAGRRGNATEALKSLKAVGVKR